MKYFIQNLGCQMNQADSERIQSVFGQMGLERTDDEQEARVLGMVACSVRQKAIDKVYSKIHEWNLRKSDQNLITFVSGCILPADEKNFKIGLTWCSRSPTWERSPTCFGSTVW